MILNQSSTNKYDDDDHYGNGGSLYRAVVYKNILYLLRKQSVDIAYTYDLSKLKSFNLRTDKIDADLVKFEKIESDSIPDEDKVEPPPKPKKRLHIDDLPMNYLEKIEQNDNRRGINQTTNNTNEDRGKIIDLRNSTFEKESDSDNDDLNKSTTHKLDFSLKPKRNKEAQKFNDLKKLPPTLESPNKPIPSTIKALNLDEKKIAPKRNSSKVPKKLAEDKPPKIEGFKLKNNDQDDEVPRIKVTQFNENKPIAEIPEEPDNNFSESEKPKSARKTKKPKKPKSSKGGTKKKVRFKDDNEEN